MTEEVSGGTRKIVLELDNLDYDCFQAEVARYQATKRTADGVLLPDGESNLVGAVVCELIRDLLDYRDLHGADVKGLYDLWRLAHADWQEALAERDRLAAENARLREAFCELAGGGSGMRSLLERFWHISEWWLETTPRQERIVPPHIVALQEAIYREGGE